MIEARKPKFDHDEKAKITWIVIDKISFHRVSWQIDTTDRSNYELKVWLPTNHVCEYGCPHETLHDLLNRQRLPEIAKMLEPVLWKNIKERLERDPFPVAKSIITIDYLLALGKQDITLSSTLKLLLKKRLVAFLTDIGLEVTHCNNNTFAVTLPTRQ
jgi:hypothetical protein